MDVYMGLEKGPEAAAAGGAAMWPLIGMQGLSTAANIWGNINANKNAREIAREQMAFQERMSNTAYQRSVSDMRKAGLNPLLAYGNSGGSTPSGSIAPVRNIMEGTSSSALDIVRLKKDIEEAQSRIELNAESTKTQVVDQMLKGQQYNASKSAQMAQDLQNWLNNNRQKIERENPELFGWLDAFTKRISDVMGVATDAKSLSKPHYKPD